MSKFLQVGTLLALTLISFSGTMQAEAKQHHDPVTVWVQVMDSCRQGLPGASFNLIAPDGKTIIQTQTSTGIKRVTVSSSGKCPLQHGDCQTVLTGCLSFSIIPPSTGTTSYTIQENPTRNAQDGFYENPSGMMPFTGFVPCNGGSACGGALTPPFERATFTINSSGTVTAVTTNILPDGKTATYPSSGNSLGTQKDPVVFHNFQLGNGSCDGDHDDDDHLTGSPSSHCDNDTDK
jgi:hypothetical protein